LKWSRVVLIGVRSGVPADGGEMPVWGNRASAGARRPRDPVASAEAMMPRTRERLTPGRIMAIACCLESIQQ